MDNLIWIGIGLVVGQFVWSFINALLGAWYAVVFFAFVALLAWFTRKAVK